MNMEDRRKASDFVAPTKLEVAKPYSTEGRATSCPTGISSQIINNNSSSNMNYSNYREFLSWYNIPKDNKWNKRSWPDKRIIQAPRWCSVDLRDGNQSLINPMDISKKIYFFKHLISLGFKEIEIGFPSASDTDFNFCRHIIDNNLIPDDVFIQVLTQCRESLIIKTINAVKGAKNIILHFYNSTSELQRRVVFNMNKNDIKNIALNGAKLLKQLSDDILNNSNVIFEYSAESFTGTELDFVINIHDEIINILAPESNQKIILNLPSTVEMSTPNVYADQIEWICSHLNNRDKTIVSIHPHNDRGCAIASAELALLAGADRIEGCLFGNGERTGNVCLVTLAINLMSQGIDPELDFRNIQTSIDVAEYCNELKIPERYPWAGSLVFTAFSGSHQDAINKGMNYIKTRHYINWEVPYLPINPNDIGKTYEKVIRINSQSGKGGISYILERDFNIILSKDDQIKISKIIKNITDKTGREITPAEIYNVYLHHF